MSAESASAVVDNFTPITDMPGKPAPAAAPADGRPRTDSGVNHWAAVLGMLVYVGIGAAIAWNTDAGNRFLRGYWWTVATGAVVFVLALQVKRIRATFAKATAQKRVALIIFGVVPLMLTGMFALFLLRTVELQVATLRTVFLVIVCCLPAIMYYLFIATKKNSLLNEFLINLDRLGLLTPRHLHERLLRSGLAKDTCDERRKMLTYVQRFEAVYGAIPTELSGMVIDPTKRFDSASMRQIRSDTPGALFTLDTAIPVLLATVLIALGWLITLPPWQGQFNWRPLIVTSAAALDTTVGEVSTWTVKWVGAFSPLKTPVHFAFIGAYFFSLQMLFRRYVRRDLRASAYVAVAQRIILSVIGTWVTVQALQMTTNGKPIVSNDDLMIIGFVIGVFPRVAWQVVQACFKRFTGAALVLPTLQAQLPISDLDGLTVWHEARLEEEDIENIPNMATADLVDLFINTRFPPDRVIDWVDQAILYTHLGPIPKGDKALNPREVLRGHGIRTASSLIAVYEASQKNGAADAFEKVLDPADSPSKGRIRSLVDAVQTNPNLALIETWRGLRAA